MDVNADREPPQDVGPFFGAGAVLFENRYLPDGQVFVADTETARSALRELVSYAVAAHGPPRGLVFRMVAEEEAILIRRMTGIEAGRHQWLMDADAIRHAWRSHGSAATEQSRGQIPLNLGDFEQVPIIARWENLVQAGVGKRGQPVLIFSGRSGSNRLTAVFEERTKRRQFAFMTLYRGK